MTTALTKHPPRRPSPRPVPRSSCRPLRRPSRHRARQAGFSLIEVLVVLTLIGLLMSFAAVALGRYREAGRITDCKARIEGLSLLAESYADRQGSHPPARLAELGIEGANSVNEGIEAFTAALRDRRYAGKRPDERWLGNSDDDRHEELQSADGSSALLEVHDPWGQPFVYQRSDRFGEPSHARVGEGAAALDQETKARKNPLTGGWHRFDGFQLRSAGPDGLFDTEDDVANFEIDTAPGG